MNNSQPIFSVILPLYKQASQAEYLYKEYTSALEKLGDTWELMFIVNGKNDGAQDILKKLAAGKENIKTLYLENGGWGRAVKFGLRNATGKFLCYTNSARTEINDLLLILKYAKVNDDNAVKATRIIREKFTRKLGSVLYNFENRLLFKTPLWDVNGTPKVIPKKIIDSIEIISDGDVIDAEIMARCFKMGVRIIEIPVVSTQRISGKSTTNFKSAFNMYKGLWQLRKKI